MTMYPGGHQRIGHRYDLGGLDVRWGPEGTQRGRLVNLSVTGAGIEAPTDPRAAIGEPLQVEIDGHPVEVIVRDIRATDRDGQHYYGVQFVEMPQALIDVLNELIDGTPSGGGLEDIWNRSS